MSNKYFLFTQKYEKFSYTKAFSSFPIKLFSRKCVKSVIIISKNHFLLFIRIIIMQNALIILIKMINKYIYDLNNIKRTYYCSI